MPLLVSIIIPCFNAERFVREAVESAVGQTWKPVEVIMVDDGSTDGTAKALERWRSRCKIIRQSRQGAAAARNRGLLEAKGDYIQFLDADDLLSDNKVESQMGRLAGCPRNWVASGSWGRFRESPALAAFAPEPVWKDAAPPEFLVSSWLGGGMMPVFSWLTPRELIKEAGPWDENLSVNDDGEFFTRVILKSSGIVFCEGARGYYRTAAGATLSQRGDRAAAESAYEATQRSCEHFLAVTQSEEVRCACATAYQRFAYWAFPDYPDLSAKAEARGEELGGCGLPVGGGLRMRFLSACLGWKRAKRIQRLRRRLIGTR